MTKTWTTVSGGAPVGDKILDRYQPKDQVKFLRLIEDGAIAFRGVLGKPAVEDKIAVGCFCHKLQATFTESEYRKIVETYWLQDGRDYSSVERELQDCKAIYKFSIRKGPRLAADIPIDSYRKIMQYIRGIKGGTDTVKIQNKCIREINLTRSFDGVSVGKTKLLRNVLRMAKLNLQNEREKLYRAESVNSKKKSNLIMLERLEGQIDELGDTVNEIIQSFSSEKSVEKATGMRNELVEILDRLYVYLEKKTCL
nr:hypothetical protein BdHM001_10050 [Bdellovibrio sp. HM001]